MPTEVQVSGGSQQHPKQYVNNRYHSGESAQSLKKSL